MKRFLLFSLLALILTACVNKEADQSNSDIGFEIKNFAITTEDKSNDDIVPSISWTGRGVVRVVGSPEVLKGNYIVFIKGDRIKGGDQSKEAKGNYSVLIEEGIGELSLYESVYLKESQQKSFEAPQYTFEVYGYVPITPLKRSKEEITKK